MRYNASATALTVLINLRFSSSLQGIARASTALRLLRSSVVLCATAWPKRRLVRALGIAIASVALLSLTTSCSVTRKATEVSSSTVQVSSVETRDTVREQVMVAVHDTIREVTTITVQTNDAGD